LSCASISGKKLAVVEKCRSGCSDLKDFGVVWERALELGLLSPADWLSTSVVTSLRELGWLPVMTLHVCVDVKHQCYLLWDTMLLFFVCLFIEFDTD